MAYYSGQGIDITLTASGDMSNNIYRFVSPASTIGRFQLSSACFGPEPFGVLQDKPRTLEEGRIRVHGVTQLAVNADTAVNYGDFLTSNSVGHGIVVSTGGSTPYQAIALDAVTSGSGVVISVLLARGQVVADNSV